MGDGLWSPEFVRHCTLICSLEPCPMCMTRLICAGIGTVLHLSDDSVGGMVQRKSALPPIFREITEDQKQVWGRAECSEDLRRIAFNIWDQSRGELTRRLPGRGNRMSEE
jgi:tRNA(adenine34) deaminase